MKLNSHLLGSISGMLCLLLFPLFCSAGIQIIEMRTNS